MKKAISVLTFALLQLLLPGKAKAQTATATSKATAYTSKTDGKTTASHSVSAQNSDSGYSLKAEFEPGKTAEVKEALLSGLNRQYLTESSGKWHWKKEQNSETAYSFVLSEGKLKISIDKDLLSANDYQKLEKLSEKVAGIISGK